MATRAFTVFMPMDARGNNIIGAIGVKWTGLLNGDTGSPYPCPHRSEKVVQVYGTFGTGGNCRIEGSNDQAYDTEGNGAGSPAPTYAPLSDPQANQLDFAAAKLEKVLENPLAVRPSVTAGDGTTSLTVVMIISSSARL